MENQTIFWCVSSGFQCPKEQNKKRLRFGTHDIYMEESIRGNKTGRIKIF
jgi:hypothetical protein